MRQSGLAMVEALVAAGLLGLGLLGATRLLTHAFDAARHARQQTFALSLTQEAMDCALGTTAPCPPAEQVLHQGVRYSVRLEVQPMGAHLREMTVQVDWQDGKAPRKIEGRTRVSDVPDWLGLSLP